MRRQSVVKVVALGMLGAVIIVGPGCAPAASSPGGGDPNAVEVVMQNIAFNPPAITIQAGQTVRWTNRDPVGHTVTSGDPGDADAGALFDSGLVFFGGSFERTFNQPGTFVYFCRTHPNQMFGATVTVE